MQAVCVILISGLNFLNNYGHPDYPNVQFGRRPEEGKVELPFSLPLFGSFAYAVSGSLAGKWCPRRRRRFLTAGGDTEVFP